ncbi:alpha/beta-hydrolase [Hypoxylon trugodes]|uniref:alpha/beta-hydrolase n=1 Tax=Hypoxylon trugodes TaxID=326681 RepID=UPI00218FF8A8|nr:alpha/beta-hydrolase [Hypoxylon trugodes]KAI1385715.1 alpha/beta-hydrolase [Hypoxylon trugodes]
MMASFDHPPIRPNNDERVTHHYAELNGCRYHYLLSLPVGGKYTQTVFLIHGWPDVSMGWRYQIPMLVANDYRVVAPDIMGLGGTDAPAPLEFYGYKRASDDIAELARQLGCKSIILGGHDWGGAIVHRTCLWHPKLVSHVFTVCTPFFPPTEQFISHQTLVDGPAPQLGYQLQFSGPDVEAVVKSDNDIRSVLSAMYGGVTQEQKRIFDPTKGIDLAKLPLVGESRLLNGEVLDYYGKEFSRKGLHSGFNWYRNRRVNYEDDLKLEKKTIDVPCLFVFATRDLVLTKGLATGMENHVSQLTRKELDAGHFALVEKPQEVNSILKEWLQDVNGPTFREKNVL